MTYLPAELTRSVDLADLPNFEQPALFVSEDDGTKILVADDQAIFLDGDFAFEVMRQVRPGDWRGALYEGVSIEVDPNSVAFGKASLGSIVHHTVGVSLMGQKKDASSFMMRNPVPIASSAEPPPGAQTTFRRWRIVKVVREQAIELAVFSAAAVTQP
ncbi:hypothetical protein SAMN06297144_3444 [Sphingomonas guangdongensis]|uniref:Uncharacterized protein n=1 Tax=Sphingomonas guangdongensis TaxID=1141890 RepID=A0A285R2G9_9SPHN|nr:hypothetical protein [Sphingomonas guangdongensis]SOB88293.1 hypothetical protein SAMN06297144_3444 [Sphingomonas guangdongensis]